MDFKSKLIAVILTIAAGLYCHAAPLSPNILGPTNGVGSYTVVGHHQTARVAYQVSFNSSFGGHWNLSGTHTEPGYHAIQQYFEDSFSGSVSDTSINGTFTNASFSWLVDAYLFCLPPLNRIVQAQTFSIKINNGVVSGWARY